MPNSSLESQVKRHWKLFSQICVFFKYFFLTLDHEQIFNTFSTNLHLISFNFNSHSNQCIWIQFDNSMYLNSIWQFNVFVFFYFLIFFCSMLCVELKSFKQMQQQFECKQMLNKIEHLEFEWDVKVGTLHVY